MINQTQMMVKGSANREAVAKMLRRVKAQLWEQRRAKVQTQWSTAAYLQGWRHARQWVGWRKAQWPR